MARVTIIPDVEKIELPDAGQATPRVHDYLRQRILDGSLEPGLKLSRPALARRLGVTPTPLWQALRMLHEEGLVDVEPDQGTRVTALDPRELDGLYASRILLATLAVSVAAPSFGPAFREDASRLLSRLREAEDRGDAAGWFDAHTRYHALLTAGSGDAMRRELHLLSDRITRYVRPHHFGDAVWRSARDVEHQQILDALADGRRRDALVGLAHHLANIAGRAVSGHAPGHELVAVPRAVGLVEGLPRS
ncbi:GntR family transcriptional regulator [Streptomyces sp. NPDC001514]